MKFDKKKLTNKKLERIYKALVKPRLIEEKMLILLRQGKISKWFSGIGQEAISVGATLALRDSEYILPMHRNLGVFTTRGMDLGQLFSQFQGRLTGFTKGRDRSFHFGSKEHKIVGMISHLGPQLAIADGIALSSLLNEEGNATIVFTGDGGSSEGDFHEALNVAAVWNLPVIFIIENNGYGLSTPSSQQFKFKNFVDKGPGYGIDAFQVDGNNILEVYHEIERLAKQIRKRPRPIILEAITFRMRGHEEASGTRYVPQELMDFWAQKDPIENYEKFLLDKNILSQEQVDSIKQDIRQEIDEGLRVAAAQPMPVANAAHEEADMYAPFVQEVVEPDNSSARECRFVDAISEGLYQSLEKYPELIFMGQDVADYGGVFKISEGFVEKFGPERIRNTPLCEAAIIGTGLGLSIKGQKAVVEMQFADFVTEGFNQIINNLAKIQYRWGQNADVVVRMPTGAGVAAGPFHSQSNEAWFFHTPGLKIVYPSNPRDAKGLLNAAIEDPNPVLYFEHKALYRSLTGSVAEDYYTTEIGKAEVVQEGEEATIITYGMGVHWAKKVISEIPEADVEIIDLRTLLPWDKKTVIQSVEKTGRVLVLHEDTLTGGIGAEVAAYVGEHCFMSLDAPIVRVASLDTAVPFSAVLENDFLANARLKEKLLELLDF